MLICSNQTTTTTNWNVMFEWKRRTTLHMNMNMNICSIQNRKWWRRMQKQEVAYLTNECLFLLMWNTIPATTYAYHNHSLHMQDTNTNVHFVFSVFFFFGLLPGVNRRNFLFFLCIHLIWEWYSKASDFR